MMRTRWAVIKNRNRMAISSALVIICAYSFECREGKSVRRGFLVGPDKEMKGQEERER